MPGRKAFEFDSPCRLPACSTIFIIGSLHSLDIVHEITSIWAKK